MLPLRSQMTRKFVPSKVTAGTSASLAELDTRMPLGSRRAPAWVRRAAQISVASSARPSVQTARYRPPPNATTGAALGPVGQPGDRIGHRSGTAHAHRGRGRRGRDAEGDERRQPDRRRGKERTLHRIPRIVLRRARSPR